MLLTSLVAASLSLSPLPSQRAWASCCGCCSCIDLVTTDAGYWAQDVIAINMHIFTTLLLNRQLWWDYAFWQQEMLPVFMNIGEQMSAVGTQQVMIIGTFMDASEMMETQRMLQEMHAKAHKDYHPAVGLCEFGSRIKSLAATERKTEINALALSERSIDRLLGNTAVAAADGPRADVRYRFLQFQTQFCDVYDEGYGLDALCPQHKNMGALTLPQREHLNADIDYARTLQNPLTVNLDMTDGTNINNQERELFALASNLYGYDSFHRFSPEALQNDPNLGLSPAQNTYLDLRSVVAKSNVAENSFNALVAMKSEGTDGSFNFLEAYLEKLGITDSTELERYLGENPSYYAQMEILTKKAYQSAEFYTNLYDKPANVERKGVAMQAIGLIQKFDLLKSYLRTESSLSVLLELSVAELQNEIEDAINAFDVSAD
ncbi:MAG: hypothetical protein OEY94_03885 [Alphaproteobacteria bacterium]|nr:hypothetical protein [Alphaproteobacteria bacterium]